MTRPWLCGYYICPPDDMALPWAGLPDSAPVDMGGRGPYVQVDRLSGPLAVVVGGQPHSLAPRQVQPHPRPTLGTLGLPPTLPRVGHQGSHLLNMTKWFQTQFGLI